MPYLRVYLPETSIGQKRRIAQKLIELTMYSLQQRRASDRRQITIQFLPESLTSQPAACQVEVLSRELPLPHKQAFAEQVEPMLVRCLHLRAKNKLARLIGIKAAVPPTVEVRFLPLAPHDTAMADECPVGDALIDDWERAA